MPSPTSPAGPKLNVDTVASEPTLAISSAAVLSSSMPLARSPTEMPVPTELPTPSSVADEAQTVPPTATATAPRAAPEPDIPVPTDVPSPTAPADAFSDAAPEEAPPAAPKALVQERCLGADKLGEVRLSGLNVASLGLLANAWLCQVLTPRLFEAPRPRSAARVGAPAWTLCRSLAMLP